MFSAQEELQKAREAEIARGLLETQALHGMLAEHKTLDEKHEELSHLQAEQAKETLNDMNVSQEQNKKAGEMWKSTLVRSFEETYKAAQEEHKGQMTTYRAQKA